MQHIILGLLFIFTGPWVNGQISPSAAIGDTALASSLVSEAIANNQSVGMAAGFSRDGKVVWTKGEGWRDEKSMIPFTPDTPTRIASLAKPMTAVAIMQLVESGKIDLELPLTTYIPELQNTPLAMVTTRQVLNHSSGIAPYANAREQENRKDYQTLEQAMAIFQHRPLLAEPGTAFNYSTYGYVILGYLIEKVSGLSYADYMQTNIWTVAGMNDTRVEKAGLTDQSKLYHKKSNGKIKVAKSTNVSDRIPGGGITSTLQDLLKFSIAILEDRLIKKSTLDLMLKDSALKKEGNPYGLGWYLYGKNPDHGLVVGHTGTQTGASTLLLLLPEQAVSIAVISNTSGVIDTVFDTAVKLFDMADPKK
jgi:CubicO group peptidase (beta-lactamase class C family)